MEIGPLLLFLTFLVLICFLLSGDGVAVERTETRLWWSCLHSGVSPYDWVCNGRRAQGVTAREKPCGAFSQCHLHDFGPVPGLHRRKRYFEGSNPTSPGGLVRARHAGTRYVATLARSSQRGEEGGDRQTSQPPSQWP